MALIPRTLPPPRIDGAVNVWSRELALTTRPLTSSFRPREGIVRMTARGRRMTASHRAQLAVAVAVVPVGLSPLLLALHSDHLERPVATGLYRAYLTVVPMLIGLYWWRRRPASR